MKRLPVFFSCFLLTTSVMAQQPNISYMFYGFVRDEVFYNSRKNVEAVDGDFHLYPLDKSFDSKGNDLNASPNSSMYSFTTRFGVNLRGPDVGSAKLSARVEADFTGSAATPFLLYLRQAYMKLDWEGGSSLLAGQTWHPLFGEVAPDVLNLATGGPFQPFNRSPMLRYQYGKGRFTFSVAAIYQLTSLSPGVNGKSEEYLKYSMLPELFAGINYRHKGFLAGAGVELLSIKPRLQTSNNVKVNEHLTTTSFVAQAQYTTGAFFMAGKTFLASNLGHTSQLGGYGISSIDLATGRQEYVSPRHSTSWLNLTYGHKWRGGLFLGYSKNLGTGQALLNHTFYGNGFNIDQLAALMPSFSYNLPHWKAGLEYSLTTAWYGEVNLPDGKVSAAYPVTNHRILVALVYFF
ncbi:MAG: hypothetical protein LBQ65_00195 [Tannerellaceae bacterium]|jgi:hypothetical protein|nr:hypothetical protein [Tannerellaceae bacterium]